MIFDHEAKHHLRRTTQSYLDRWRTETESPRLQAACFISSASCQTNSWKMLEDLSGCYEIFGEYHGSTGLTCWKFPGLSLSKSGAGLWVTGGEAAKRIWPLASCTVMDEFPEPSSSSHHRLPKTPLRSRSARF